MGAAVARVAAVLMLAALLAAVFAYPLDLLVTGGALAAYAAVLWWRPALWLLLVPALLPVFDLAPWTGQFFLEELDLLLMATCAVGYWRLAGVPRDARLPRFYKAALAMVALAFLVSGTIGLLPLAPLDANAFSNYLSNYNSVRVAKGLLWALLLLPLLLRSAGPELAHLQRYFVPGMLLGLALSCLAIAWERATFPGLLDFASDYRPTAPFSAMHTGGAALDAYLALAFPFVALWLLGARTRLQLALGLALMLLAMYAGLATFSRDVYLAYGTAGAVLALLVLGHRLRRGTATPGALGLAALVLALCGAALVPVFGSSGYRGLGAAIALLGAAVLLAGAPRRLREVPLCAAAALVLLGTTGLLYAVSAKGAYLAMALNCAVFGAGALLMQAGGDTLRGARGHALACAAFPAMAVACVLVALHWGGTAALGGIALPVLLALALLAANRMRSRPLWQLGRTTLTLGAIGATVFALLIPMAGSYYAGTRFATVGSDIGVRLGHWGEALDMMTPGWQSSVAGMGLGRYPATYYWKNNHGELPGSYSFISDKDGNTALRLGAPQYAQGYGEVLRMLQQVDLKPDQRYQLALDVRRTRGDTRLQVAACERWLIFPRNCVPVTFKLEAADGQWHHYSAALASGRMGTGRPAPPIRLELAADGAGGTLDVDNVSLRDTGGAELLSNGGFSAGNDFWFFSSDRNHFPWHVKNVAVYVYFEMGAFGALALGLFALYTLGSLAARGLHGDLYASVCAAALAAFLVVGMFDSLFDVPRLTLLFFLVAGAACLATRRRVRARTRRRAAPDDTAAPT